VRELVLDDSTPFVPLVMTKRGREIDYEAKAVVRKRCFNPTLQGAA